MNVFDIIGPIMIGPSSSHTAGAVRIGNVSRLILGDEAVQADILLHGSFARTYMGHGTDRALAAGILGMKPDDERIRDSLDIAAQRGVDIRFITGHIQNAHPNTAQISLTGKNGSHVRVCGASVGGGNIRILEINGRELSFSGDYPTVIVIYNDVPGMISAITAEIAKHNVNIYKINVGRDARGGTAIVCLEMDGAGLPSSVKQDLESLKNVQQATVFDIHQ